MNPDSAIRNPQSAFVAAVLALMLICVGCSTSSMPFRRDEAKVYSGTIETREIRVGSKIGGRITEILVEEGQALKPGQGIARFDVADIEAQRAQAQARIAQQEARLSRLQHGARPEEIAQATAASSGARAAYESIRNWPRPEEVEQARAALAAAGAEVSSAESVFARTQKLHQSGDIPQAEFDAVKFRLENLRARRDAEKKRLDVLLNGSRAEDVRAAEQRYQQVHEAERLVRAGPRAEEIADARAQLAEARARLEQINVQLAEGEIKAPAAAMVESISVRPGDLVVPNQAIARLLESNQIFVRIYIPEPLLGAVSIGQRAHIKVDTFRDKTFDGVIEHINAQGEFTPRNVQSRDERNHQVFGVRVRLDNRGGELKSGMAADVTLEEKK